MSDEMGLKKIWVIVLMMSASLLAQPQRQFNRPRTESSMIADIMDQIASNDADVRKQGLEMVRTRMTTKGLVELRSIWLKALMNARHQEDAANLALEGILNYPWETKSIEPVLAMRVKALLAMGKTEEALAAAKSLYNVSTMAGTSDAILNVAEALNAARANDKEIFNKFRDEQVAGATLGVGKDRASSSVMASIKVDPKVYEEALKKISGEDAQSLLGRGNLLLMADRPKEAKAIFDRLYSLTSADLAEASEALARQMKAEDGTIGRANAWVVSIRPKK